MKTVSIGDTHGLAVADIVSEIIDNHDKFIFAGDYVDSFTIDDLTIQKNLVDLIELKKKYPEKIILLLGNHDIQYLLGYDKYGCSGYRPKMQLSLYELFSKNRDLFLFSYQINNTIWTHAGIHKGWYEYRLLPFLKKNGKESLTISEQLNFAFEQLYYVLFDVGHIRGGFCNVGGPIWCDISELKSSPIKNYNQIVGHNIVKNKQIINVYNIEIAFIDVLQNKELLNKDLFYYKEFKSYKHNKKVPIK